MKEFHKRELDYLALDIFSFTDLQLSENERSIKTDSSVSPDQGLYARYLIFKEQKEGGLPELRRLPLFEHKIRTYRFKSDLSIALQPFRII